VTGMGFSRNRKSKQRIIMSLHRTMGTIAALSVAFYAISKNLIIEAKSLENRVHGRRKT